MDPDAPRPTLTKTRSGNSWRLPLVAVVVSIGALAGVVVLGRTDLPPSGTPTRPPTQINLFEPPPPPTQAPFNQLVGVMPRSPDGLTYADGIPTDISTLPVYRVRDALLVPVGRTLLVGGWYRLPDCRSTGRLILRCAPSTLSDVALVVGQGDVRTSFIALDSRLEGIGAHVVRAIVVDDPDCSIHDVGACQPRLEVLEDVWSDG
ncbi:MAG TPA: hypothetical protein VM284_05665 [Candidatus Limnocylindria bacterium]|nr:hypothetical protein [Candidatus Limnocylindria bacterium]